MLKRKSVAPHPFALLCAVPLPAHCLPPLTLYMSKGKRRKRLRVMRGEPLALTQAREPQPYAS